MELCDLTGPSTSLKACIYQPRMWLTMGTWAIYPVSNNSVSPLHVPSLLIPTRPRDVHTLASSLCRWGDWHTQRLSDVHPVTRLIGHRDVIWTQELGLQNSLCYKSKTGPHAACKTSQGSLSRESSSNPGRAPGREQKPGPLYLQGLRISKTLVAVLWGQPCVI